MEQKVNKTLKTKMKDGGSKKSLLLFLEYNLKNILRI